MFEQPTQLFNRGQTIDKALNEKGLRKFRDRLIWIYKETQRDAEFSEREEYLDFLVDKISRLNSILGPLDPKKILTPKEPGHGGPNEKRAPLSDEHKENIRAGILDAIDEKQKLKQGLQVDMELHRRAGG